MGLARLVRKLARCREPQQCNVAYVESRKVDNYLLRVWVSQGVGLGGIDRELGEGGGQNLESLILDRVMS